MLIAACATSLPGNDGLVVRLSHHLGTAALSLFALHKLVFNIFVKIEKIADAPFPLTSCFRHVRACVETGHSMPIKFACYPVYLAIAVAVALVFRSMVVMPVRQRIEDKLLGDTVARNRRPSPITEGRSTIQKSSDLT
jgi:peptidoglycan/LPS O-acetylase OafA/YrhL